MSNLNILGLSIGESFAEICVVNAAKNNEVLLQRRTYMPKENLKNFLTQFATENSQLKIDRAFVGFPFLEKILNYRLGGSVAQIVTDGFENWMQLRGPSIHQAPLASPELVFSVSARLQADGTELKPLLLDELVAIEAKLKLMECKRVCIHFVHGQRFHQHVEQAASFFREHGYEIFVPSPDEKADEIVRWRRNVLNASLSGTMAEIRKEIEEGLQSSVSSENIFHFSACGKIFQNENHLRLGAMIAPASSLAKLFPQEETVLYLDIEKFLILKPQQFVETWQSPWGLVESPHHQAQLTLQQPTSPIEVNVFGELDFGSKDIGFEPGPMCLGRGVKPTMIDLWSQDLNVPGLSERIQSNYLSKVKSHLLTLGRSCRQRPDDLDKTITELQKLSLAKLCQDALWNSSEKGILVAGPLAPFFGPQLNKLSKDFRFEKVATTKAYSFARVADLKERH